MQSLRVEGVVGVEKTQDSTGGARKAPIERVSLPLILLSEKLKDVWMTTDEGFDDSNRVIGRATILNDDLKMGIFLVNQALQGLCDVTNYKWEE